MAKGDPNKPGIVTTVRGGGGTVRGDVPHSINPMTWLQRTTMQHVQDRADVNGTGLAANHMVFQEPHNASQYRI